MKRALDMASKGVYSHFQLCLLFIIIVHGDSKLLSGFPILDHGNPDNNLESLCITENLICGN
jgi:hypothetical protein